MRESTAKCVTTRSRALASCYPSKTRRERRCSPYRFQFAIARTSVPLGKTMKQKILTALLACLVPLSVFGGAQAFPDRPVKLVVSSPPGSPPDIMARLLTDKMAAALGQPVVVENRAGGAGGLIAANAVIAADPDGYTVMMGSTSTLLTAPLIYKNAGYSAQTFTPVAGVSETAEVLTIQPSVAARSVAELVSL